MEKAVDVRAAFNEYLHRIELNSTRVRTASLRYNAIKSQIESALPEAKVKQVGSFQRKTKIRPAKDNGDLDIDVLVILRIAHRFAKSHERSYSTNDGLEEVKSGLTDHDTYKAMKPRKDAPVVTLKYTDGFRFELIPALIDGTGVHTSREEPASYLVATANGWQPNDYDFDAASITAMNQSDAVKGKLVPVIKILKHFNRVHDIPLKSFHTELLVATVLVPQLVQWNKARMTWSFQHMLAAYFSLAANRVQTPVQLVGSVTPAFDSELTSRQLRQVAKDFETLGETAWKLCEVDGSNAVKRWAKFMGDPFPNSI